MRGRRFGGDEGDERGFSLVEILIVVVVLGALASVAVLAVRGVGDRGERSAIDADRNILVTAQEAYQARHGQYATEADLVSDGLLRRPSSLHDVVLNADGTYTITVVGTPPTTVP